MLMVCFIIDLSCVHQVRVEDGYKAVQARIAKVYDIFIPAETNMYLKITVRITMAVWRIIEQGWKKWGKNASQNFMTPLSGS